MYNIFTVEQDRQDRVKIKYCFEQILVKWIKLGVK
jgi:hypothetical protein